MKNIRRFPMITLAMALVTASILGDTFDDAERAAKEVIDGYERLRRLTVDEQKRLVDAICGAEEADRESGSRDAAARVKEQVSGAYDRLRDARSTAIDKLKAVLGDEKYVSKKSIAEAYLSKVEEVWSRIERMTSRIRGGNNPVVAYMSKMGQEAHREYQSNSGNCTVSAWRMGSGEADCIKASSCEVIEIKPNNSKAIYAGRSQVARYVDELNKGGEAFKNLVSRNEAFSKCSGQFKGRIACYVFCPEIDDEGEARSTSMGWGMCD